ncbi:uncharacterized protein LOC130622705 [Hydractinia symbiolongicarpus]|uniref:uncharacterized protein LOC130622705 n=1 Tax=Hydractinia symbiolongicarpus TaxID=13093 RepID=UPI00254F5B5C|nr:uncharacterized protein LOC130622705 [Hydractinia symbiolongicarpus]
MALSNIHDVAHHNNEQKGVTGIAEVTDEEKHFRPNPDAKPFIPNPLPIAPTNWHFYPNENGKSVNGYVSPFWVHQPVDPENLIVAGSSASTNTLKKHIAFHLVSNVLDDEVPEDVMKEHIPVLSPRMNYPHPHPLTQERNQYNITGNNIVDAWHSNTSNFNLPLNVDRSSSDKSSINNKSIHEIWSPDPSPNGLNNLSPSDEMLNQYNATIHQSQQVIDSPNSLESPELSFEQVQTEMLNQHVVYSNEINQENNNASNQPQYCYQNLPSPVFQQYNYSPGIQHQHSAEIYPNVIPPTKSNIVMDNARPVVMDAQSYYGNPHYVGGYHYPDVNKNRVRHRYHVSQRPAPAVLFDNQMSSVEELGITLDECRDQLRHLDRDFKKADHCLTSQFRLRKSSLGEGSPVKYPPNATRVDKLIVDQQRQHQKVESLIGRIERLGFTPLHSNVGVTLDLWLGAIKDLRGARKNELANMSDTNSGYSKSHTQNDVMNLVSAVRDLTKLTRTARTIVWCAIQMLYAGKFSGSSSGE